MTLTDQIRKFALEDAGFDLIGFSSARLPEKYGQAMGRWVENGYAGGMEYMSRDAHRRSEPDKSLPGAKTVISLAVNYFHPEDEKPDYPAGKIARYAYGADYHKVIEKKLKKLSLYISQLSAGAKVKAYVDTGPVLEKAFAKEAGLGFFGKNTNIITRNYGSWVFLASLLTDLELEFDAPHTGACGSCRICIDACPTGALLGDYQLDARRCISYLTIESKDEHPDELKKGIGEWAFGCDICQSVCPYNFRAKTTTQPELYANKRAGSWLNLEEIGRMDEDAFSVTFQGSPLKRSKLTGLRRNAKTVKLNLEAGDAGGESSYRAAGAEGTEDDKSPAGGRTRFRKENLS